MRLCQYGQPKFTVEGQRYRVFALRPAAERGQRQVPSVRDPNQLRSVIAITSKKITEKLQALVSDSEHSPIAFLNRHWIEGNSYGSKGGDKNLIF